MVDVVENAKKSATCEAVKLLKILKHIEESDSKRRCSRVVRESFSI